MGERGRNEREMSLRRNRPKRSCQQIFMMLQMTSGSGGGKEDSDWLEDEQMRRALSLSLKEERVRNQEEESSRRKEEGEKVDGSERSTAEGKKRSESEEDERFDANKEDGNLRVDKEKDASSNDEPGEEAEGSKQGKP